MSENKHHFLAEELLIPNADKVDAGRVTMFCNNIVQSVVLTHGDIPKVFTRFENQVGNVSSGFFKTEEDLEVVNIIEKDSENTIIIAKNNDGVHQLIEVNSCFHITENYGYILDKNEDLEDLEIGDILPSGFLVYSATSYDEFLNLKYGKNLQTVYFAMDGQTYEDGIVISESAAKKLSHTYVSEITVSINTNNILINLYGDKENYKPFPDVGEEIQDGLLCARRVISNDVMLNNLSNDALLEIRNSDDRFNVNGIVREVFVYANCKKENMTDDFSQQLLMYMDKQLFGKVS